eukprot:TRINITY_DN171_c0_g1_i1.p1 TRINITY_DN171_c0_g1~~TRINITY_DN171_c0_g1_i1.p1  ORF type:complete len:179 (-),score=23.93 TRINITY_DN171_c0_g1_i1:811-1347(-)
MADATDEAPLAVTTTWLEPVQASSLTNKSPLGREDRSFSADNSSEDLLLSSEVRSADDDTTSSDSSDDLPLSAGASDGDTTSNWDVAPDVDDASCSAGTPAVSEDDESPKSANSVSPGDYETTSGADDCDASSASDLTDEMASSNSSSTKSSDCALSDDSDQFAGNSGDGANDNVESW